MQPQSLFILGRQPAIGRAELESVFGAGHLAPAGKLAMVCDVAPGDVPFERLGSIIRLARPVADIKRGKKWPDTARAALKQLPALISHLPSEGKIKLGISVFEMDIAPAELLRTGLEAKKICKKQNRSVRIVPNSEPALNTAQVLHNNLTGELGIELLLIPDGEIIHLAQTVAIQNIDAYTRRDRERPKRDTVRR